ncbi:hypothetical protein [Kluyvera georgiana]|uniref:hypothetical protein n=1 Tax=Kluyvera georgiana TaxID=73098 RepID=UPI0013DCC520|nr:hypothetical protein [Kluyvera georgiana]
MTLPGYFLAAQVVIKNQGGMVRYLPRGQVTHKTAGKVLSNTGGGALRDRILVGVVTIFRALPLMVSAVTRLASSYRIHH